MPTKKNEELPNCLVPDCSEVQRTRGLCKKHYSIALRVVNAGAITWAQLEKAGKALPPHRGGDSAALGWFTEDVDPEELEKAMESIRN